MKMKLKVRKKRMRKSRRRKGGHQQSQVEAGRSTLAGI